MGFSLFYILESPLFIINIIGILSNRFEKNENYNSKGGLNKSFQ